jgi:hypothetical protein
LHLAQEQLVRRPPEPSGHPKERIKGEEATIRRGALNAPERRSSQTLKLGEYPDWWLHEEDTEGGVTPEQLVDEELIPSPDLVPGLK